MPRANDLCERVHFEQHHVTTLRALRVRVDQAGAELEHAHERLKYLAEQLDALMREAAGGR